MKKNIFLVVSFNILAIGAVIVGMFFNLIQPVFMNDASHLTFVIAFLLLVNISLIVYDTIKPTKWIDNYIEYHKDESLYLGLAGTVIGFLSVVAIIGMAIGNTSTGGAGGELIYQVLGNFAGALKTSFCPTLVGIVSYLWTNRLVYLKGSDSE